MVLVKAYEGSERVTFIVQSQDPPTSSGDKIHLFWCQFIHRYQISFQSTVGRKQRKY